MNENEDLDPTLLRHLREVPPASASVRDAHIAAALAEMAPSRRTGANRSRILGGVAAAVVLAVGGVAVVIQQRDSRGGVLKSTAVITVPKGGGDCSQEFSGLWGDVGDSRVIKHNNTEYAVMFRDDNIDVYEATEPCSRIGTMGYWDQLVARDNEGSPAGSSAVCSYATEPVRRFNDRARADSYGLVLVQTDEGLSLHFEDKCDVSIVTLALP